MVGREREATGLGGAVMKMTRMAMAMAGFGLVAATGGAARAQDIDQPPRESTGTEHLRTPMGMSFQVGGGVTNFSSQKTRDLTEPGGFWDARGVFGTRSPLALEVAYVGNAEDIKAPGLDPSAVLVGQGAEADLRLQAPMVTATGVLVEPFIFGGGGWQHYSVSNAAFNASIVRQNDDVATLPFGGGIAMGYRGFLLDGRFTYRQTFDDELFPVASQ